MMLKPSIDTLLDHVNSKYSLVILASKRAHELDAGAQPTLDSFESVKALDRLWKKLTQERSLMIHIQKSNGNV